MEKAKFDLDVAKANALADYYGTTAKAALLKAEKLPNEVEAAQAYALQMSGGDAVLFQEYFKEAFKMLEDYDKKKPRELELMDRWVLAKLNKLVGNQSFQKIFK